VIEIASQNIITLDPNMDIKEAAWILSNNGIDGAPVIQGNNILGILTQTDITKAVANEEKDLRITKLMSKYIITIKQNTKLPKVIIDENETPIAIVTKTDIINKMTSPYLLH
jgi:hypothetical protein